RLSAIAAITHHSATDAAFPVPADGTFATAIPRFRAAPISTPSRPAPHCWIRRNPVIRSMSSPSTRYIAGISTEARAPLRRRTSGSIASMTTLGSARARCSRNALKPAPATTTRISVEIATFEFNAAEGSDANVAKLVDFTLPPLRLQPRGKPLAPVPDGPDTAVYHELLMQWQHACRNISGVFSCLAGRMEMAARIVR